MPINDRTTNLSLAKPNVANLLEEDVVRLREFADDVDLALNLRPIASTVTSQINAAVAGLASTSYVDAGDSGRVPVARTVGAGTGLTGGGALSGNITLNLSAGSIASLALADTSVQPARTIFTAAGLDGGGDLSMNRTISPVFATIGEAATGTATDRIMNPARTTEVVTNKAGGIALVMALIFG